MMEMQGGSNTVKVKLQRGRPKRIRKAGENILSNGLFERQWEWIQREAPPQHMDGANYLRMVIDNWIDSIEVSRVGVVATPKQDKEFEKLVKSNNGRAKKKSKRR